MLRIDSSLPPKRFIPLEWSYQSHALKVRASQMKTMDEERRQQELQWAIPEAQKAAASVSIARNEASISGMIAAMKRSDLFRLIGH